MQRQYILAAIVIGALGGLASGQTPSKNATTPTTNASADSPAVLLQKGIYQEETAGDLGAAAKTYRQIISDATSNRPYVAQAMYRLGVVCLRQKQAKEAMELFARLKAEYPEEKELVEKATQQFANARSKLDEKDVAAIVDAAVAKIATMAEGDPRITAALATLEGLDDKLVVKELAAELSSKTNEVRRSAIYILCKGPMKNIEAAVPQLEKLLDHDESFTRGMAAWALGTRKIESDYDRIVKLATEDKSPYARLIAVAGLAEMGKPEGKTVVQKIAQDDKDEMVRMAAQKTLETYWYEKGKLSPAVTAAIEEGKAATIAWLKFVDDGNYDQSFKEMAPAVRDTMNAQTWKQELLKIRTPLGKVLGRSLCEDLFSGHPQAEYLEIGYDTRFENGSRIETLTLTKDKNADWQDKNAPWRVSSYVVKSEPGAAAPTAAEKREAENLAATAWQLWGQRKLAEAEAMFQKALEKDPTAANTWNGLGWAQLNQGKKENARMSFEKAVALDPKQAAALNGLGWIAKAEGKIDDAKGWWKRAYNASPLASAPISGLAGAAFENGDYDEAVDWYEKWLKAEADNAEAKSGLEKAKTALAAAKDALPATQAWLQLVDDGKYAESWTAAADFFKDQVTADAWEKAAKSARQPFGKVSARKVKSTLYMTSVPGAPDGQYVVIQFETQFENKKSAIETVTPLKDKDGHWKVSGYYVK